MDLVLEEIKNMARVIVDNAPVPSFYEDLKPMLKRSSEFFKDNSLIMEIKNHVFEVLENNFGHGFGHAKKVAIEAGVIYVAEMRKLNSGLDVDELLFTAQTAGLLHDICRKEKAHAKKGAEYAAQYLPNVLKDKKVIDSIVYAISNHEAFCETEIKAPCHDAIVLSDSLYDSDKFRWGPDNFSHMIWAMLDSSNITASQFFRGYERGLGSLETIRETFRSLTGKKYGPEFIDIGLEIGKMLYQRICDEFDLQQNK